MKQIFIALTIIMVTLTSFSQNSAVEKIVTIQGTVSEVVNNEIVALPFVNVFVEGTADVTSTGFDGAFEIETLDLDGNVKFTFKGYRAVAKEIETETGLLVLNILLTKDNDIAMNSTKPVKKKI